MFVTLGADGTLRIERGFIRPEDEAPAETDDGGSGEADAADTDGEHVSGVVVNGSSANEPTKDDEEDGAIRPLPDRLVLDLTAERTLALRNALAGNPAVAFVAALHALVLQVFYRFASSTCLELGLKSAGLPQSQVLARRCGRRRSTNARKRGERSCLRTKPTSGTFWRDLMTRAARRFSRTASRSRSMRSWNPGTGARVRSLMPMCLARAIGFDMASAGWVPTVDNYLGRVTKARILEAVPRRGANSPRS